MRKPLIPFSRRHLIAASLMTTLAAGISGCGGNDPLAMFYDSTITPSLGLPFNTNNNTAQVTPYQPSLEQTGWEFALSNFSLDTISLVAPESGIVSDISGNGTDGYTITIFHNSRVSTRITPAEIVGVRVGDQVTRSQSIGTVKKTFSLSEITFTVFLDGRHVCPSSFLNSDALTDMVTVWSSGGLHLCLN